MTKEEIRTAICGTNTTERKEGVRTSVVVYPDRELLKKIQDAVFKNNASQAFRETSKIIFGDTIPGAREANKIVSSMANHPICICRECDILSTAFYLRGFGFDETGYVEYAIKVDVDGIGIVLDKNPEEAVVKWTEERTCSAESIVAIAKELKEKLKVRAEKLSCLRGTVNFADPNDVADAIFEEFENLKANPAPTKGE